MAVRVEEVQRIHSGVIVPFPLIKCGCGCGRIDTDEKYWYCEMSDEYYSTFECLVKHDHSHFEDVSCDGTHWIRNNEGILMNEWAYMKSLGVRVCE